MRTKVKVAVLGVDAVRRQHDDSDGDDYHPRRRGQVRMVGRVPRVHGNASERRYPYRGDERYQRGERRGPQRTGPPGRSNVPVPRETSRSTSNSSNNNSNSNSNRNRSSRNIRSKGRRVVTKVKTRHRTRLRSKRNPHSLRSPSRPRLHPSSRWTRWTPSLRTATSRLLSKACTICLYEEKR